MYRFAHISDIHLGFQQQTNLQKIEQQIFEKILDLCIVKKVNFILITGDLFHRNLPDMRVQRYAFRKFKEVYDAKIPIYVVYGSHDYSPIASSVIDLLSDVGYFIKVTKDDLSKDDKIQLDWIENSETNTKLVGISGKTTGLDRIYFENLKLPKITSKAFKIFLFHTGIDEINGKSEDEMDSIPLALLPSGFDYYAGGHVHTFSQNESKDGVICYPGTPFAGYHKDLEENANGTKRGFVIVEFDEKIKNINFVEINTVKYELIDINANGKSPNIINLEILKKISKIEANDKIIILKVHGELKSGKTSEVDFSLIKEKLFEKNSIDVKIHRQYLTSKQYKIVHIKGQKKEDIEKNIFEENIKNIKINRTELQGDEGIKFAQGLLRDLRQPMAINEKKSDYQKRIRETTLDLMGISDDI